MKKLYSMVSSQVKYGEGKRKGQISGRGNILGQVREGQKWKYFVREGDKEEKGGKYKNDLVKNRPLS